MERKVVVGIDGSSRSVAAANWAARRTVRSGLPLRVVHVAPRSARRPTRPPLTAARAVAELASWHRELEVEGVQLDGDPASVLLAQGTGADLLVLGMRGVGGFAGLPVGSVALAVAERSARPVVLVPYGPAGQDDPLRRSDAVALGVDARRPDDAAIGFAFALAQSRDDRLRVVHAWTLPVPPSRRMPFAVPEEDRAIWEDHEVQLLSDVLRPWREKYPDARVLEDVVLFGAGEALVRASSRAELLVVGRRGNTLGPAVRMLLAHAKGPVAVVPA